MTSSMAETLRRRSGSGAVRPSTRTSHQLLSTWVHHCTFTNTLYPHSALHSPPPLHPPLPHLLGWWRPSTPPPRVIHPFYTGLDNTAFLLISVQSYSSHFHPQRSLQLLSPQLNSIPRCVIVTTPSISAHWPSRFSLLRSLSPRELSPLRGSLIRRDAATATPSAYGPPSLSAHVTSLSSRDDNAPSPTPPPLHLLLSSSYRPLGFPVHFPSRNLQPGGAVYLH